MITNYMGRKNILPLLSLSFICCNLHAEDVSRFAEIVVSEAKEDALNNADITIGNEEINNELILDINDLVKNEPGVSVVQKANSGSSGFNIRGVDQDRVAILVDGIHQGETFENIIYTNYGYFDGSINEIELDSVKSVSINKGTDSLFTGSGSLGGAVSYTTKSASDLILRNKKYGLYNKTIYASNSSEVKTTSGVALKQDFGDLLVLYTYTTGHEQKTRDKGNDIYGRARSQVDPINKNSHNILVKSNLLPNDSNKITLTYENYDVDKNVDERSWELYGSNYRKTHSIGQKQRYSIDWNYKNQGEYINEIDTKIYHQKISQVKDSDVYEFKNDKKEQNYNRRLDQSSVGFDQKISFTDNNISSWSILNQLMYGYKTKKVSNDNVDTFYFSDRISTISNSIIEPVTTEHYYVALTNKIDITPSQLVAFGLRYDAYHHNVKRNGKSISDHLYSDTFVLPKDTSFSGLTYSALYDYQFNEQFNIKYKISTGFRAPNATELYFTYGDDFAANRFEPNQNLKEETGLTNELYLEYVADSWYVSFNPFYTKYNNFIDLKDEYRLVKNKYYDPIRYPKEFDDQKYFQYRNLDSAYIYGFDARFKLNVSELVDSYHPIWYQSRVSYSKGKGSDGDSLMTIQPWKWTNNFKFDIEDYNFSLYATYISKKDPQDTIRNGKPWKYTSDSALVMDFIVNYELNKNIKFNAGIFNFLNEKYKTWDSVRSIPTFGSTNMVDNDGLGLNRFTAPGVNWKAGVEIKI